MNTAEIPSSKYNIGDSKDSKEESIDSGFLPKTEVGVIEKRKKPVIFWGENPNILFKRDQMFEFFPTEDMLYEQKLNAVMRTVIVLTIVGFIISNGTGFRILMIGGITAAAIYLMHFYHEKENKKMESKKATTDMVEGFSGPAATYFQENNLPLPTNVFDEPDSSNPFSNVLVTDYDYNPTKKPAPPAFNKNVNNNILNNAKQLVADANPDQPDIVDKIFNDLGEQLYLEQSLRPFNSCPATTIPNDQGAFAEFCYGSMISCKEGNAFACARNISHYTNY